MGALARARLATALFACVSIGAQVTQLGNVAHGRLWHVGSAAAVLCIVAFIAVTYRRGRTTWLDPVVLPLLIVAAGSGLTDSINTTGLCIGVVMAQSLYGTYAMWLVRAAGAAAALPTAVSLSPYALSRPVEWMSPTVMAIIPQLLLISIAFRAMCGALVRQEQASARESVLARTGRRLLAATDVAQARDIGVEALAELTALSPGVVAAVAVRRGEHLVVVAQAGFPTDVTGTVLPTDVVAALVAQSRSSAEPGRAALGRYVPTVRQWRAAAVVARDFERYLLTGGARAVPESVFDAFLNLSHQVMLAEASCQSHAELTHQAHHDHLTTLPTRKLFFRHLARAMDDNATTAALLNIDLDDFKKVNDVYGHGAGDELLVEVAGRLVLAGGPDSVPARFGGDEFALLLTGISDPDDAMRVAERVCLALVEPVALSAAVVSVGASIGVAVPEPGMTAGDLVRCADIAMYSAKARGKNRVERFTAEEHGAIAYHRALEEHCGEAVGRGEILLRYRPLTDLRTGSFVGVEALGFWHHPDLGPLAPADYLPLAERTGHITAIGNHVLAAACAQLAQWSTVGGDETLRLGVSVAPRQVLAADFISGLADVLRETAVAPGRVTLQIVEGDDLDDDAIRERMRAVTTLGVRFAVDNFGSSSGSLVGLRTLPIHQIKVGPDLLAAKDQAMLQLVASVGDILGVDTVAAGDVEAMTAPEFVRWSAARRASVTTS